MDAAEFVAILPIVDRFDALTDPANYRSLPAGWLLAVADVTGSTKAIAAGEYKAVNTVGVSVIASITNALKPAQLPYLFGGDGALVCVPPGGEVAARTALAATAAMSKAQFGLELRAALVPVEYLRRRGHEVRVARQQVSEHYYQSAFDGGGAAFAEAALKDGTLPPEYDVEPDSSAAVDFSGLECRWQEIPSPSDETVAVIVTGAGHGSMSLPACRRAIDAIERIYGDAAHSHPITARGMRVAFAERTLKYETKLRTWRGSWKDRLRYRVLLRIQSMLGWFFFRTGARTGDTEWGRYKRDAAANSDCRKFDGALRLVVSGTPAQRAELERVLGDAERRGELRYGIHVADAAIMTCLVSRRQHEHAHFIDAAGGGYASAAKQLKARPVGPQD